MSQPHESPPTGASPDGQNIDAKTVEGFGQEWAAYDQTRLKGLEYDKLFNAYFDLFPFDQLPPNAEGFDLGCGSGRWAAGVAPRVGLLHCIDPAVEALAVARRRLANFENVEFHLASVDFIPLRDGSQDFGYSLGVLHHIPDTAAALSKCVQKLKPGSPFLVYLYYSMENRPTWFRAIWKATNIVRRRVSLLPFPVRKAVTTTIAAGIYWPLAKSAAIVERLGIDPSNIPLSAYRTSSFYSMRTDALDRFGTRLEHRFTRAEIQEIMEQAGLEGIRFRDDTPFWVGCGWRRA